MNAWKDELLRIANFGSAGQRSTPELIALLVLAFFTCAWSLGKVAKALDAKTSGTRRSAVVVVIGLLLTLAAFAAANIYVVPNVSDPLLRQAIPVACMAVAVLAVVAPLCILLLKVSYFRALVSMLLAVAAAAAVVFLTQAGIRAVKEGDKGLTGTKERRDKINEVLSK